MIHRIPRDSKTGCDQMRKFPDFMKNTDNRIDPGSQYSDDIEGYVFESNDGSQITYWTCHKDRRTKGHSHDFDEYLVCVKGGYSVTMAGTTHTLRSEDELHIPKGTIHGGHAKAGTRTIHVFGGKRIN